MSITGISYDVLMEFEQNITDRGKFKQDVNTVLNKDTDSNWTSYGVDKIYMDYFIEVYKIIMKFKKSNYKNFGHRMTQWEADYVRPFWKALLDEGTPFIPIHDGIIVSNDESRNLLIKMQDESRKKYGLTAPLKFEEVA